MRVSPNPSLSRWNEMCCTSPSKNIIPHCVGGSGFGKSPACTVSSARRVMSRLTHHNCAVLI